MTKITHSEEYRAVLDAAAKIAAMAGRTFFTSADLFAGLAFVAPEAFSLMMEFLRLQRISPLQAFDGSAVKNHSAGVDSLLSPVGGAISNLIAALDPRGTDEVELQAWHIAEAFVAFARKRPGHGFLPVAEERLAGEMLGIARLKLVANRPVVFLREELLLESPACLWTSKWSIWLRANWYTYVCISPDYIDAGDKRVRDEAPVEALMKASTLLLSTVDGERRRIPVREVNLPPSIPDYPEVFETSEDIENNWPLFSTEPEDEEDDIKDDVDNAEDDEDDGENGDEASV